jgi:hypothetical protein
MQGRDCRVTDKYYSSVACSMDRCSYRADAVSSSDCTLCSVSSLVEVLGGGWSAPSDSPFRIGFADKALSGNRGIRLVRPVLPYLPSTVIANSHFFPSDW